MGTQKVGKRGDHVGFVKALAPDKACIICLVLNSPDHSILFLEKPEPFCVHLWMCLYVCVHMYAYKQISGEWWSVEHSLLAMQTKW